MILEKRAIKKPRRDGSQKQIFALPANKLEDVQEEGVRPMHTSSTLHTIGSINLDKKASCSPSKFLSSRFLKNNSLLSKNISNESFNSETSLPRVSNLPGIME